MHGNCAINISTMMLVSSAFQTPSSSQNKVLAKPPIPPEAQEVLNQSIKQILDKWLAALHNWITWSNNYMKQQQKAARTCTKLNI